jgi:hypothetical protein
MDNAGGEEVEEERRERELKAQVQGEKTMTGL